MQKHFSRISLSAKRALTAEMLNFGQNTAILAEILLLFWQKETTFGRKKALSAETVLFWQFRLSSEINDFGLPSFGFGRNSFGWPLVRMGCPLSKIYVQSCVETFLLSSEKHPKNVVSFLPSLQILPSSIGPLSLPLWPTSWPTACACTTAYLRTRASRLACIRKKTHITPTAFSFRSLHPYPDSSFVHFVCSSVPPFSWESAKEGRKEVLLHSIGIRPPAAVDFQ